VIPAYNAAAFIEKTLESVRAQTYRDYEIVVTDDGSKDDTQKVVEGWLARTGLPGRCIRQPNGKIAAARNTAMRASRGSLIALLDHDDIWYPEKLAKVTAVFDARPDVDLVGHHINVTKDGKVVWTAKKGPAGADMYERLLLVGNALAPSATVFKKDKALAIGGFRENPEFNTVEDYDFWMRFSKVASYHFIDEVLAEYPLVETSASSRVEYHHGNLETLLRVHFAEHFGPNPGLAARVAMRKRMAQVYRSAAGKLLESGAPKSRRSEYVVKMLKEFPLDPKNLARAAQCLFSK
jgi:glycosyltransferase involved in cell wall biosynthesis